jgi:hypothetical protein
VAVWCDGDSVQAVCPDNPFLEKTVQQATRAFVTTLRNQFRTTCSNSGDSDTAGGTDGFGENGGGATGGNDGSGNVASEVGNVVENVAADGGSTAVGGIEIEEVCDVADGTETGISTSDGSGGGGSTGGSGGGGSTGSGGGMDTSADGEKPKAPKEESA